MASRIYNAACRRGLASRANRTNRLSLTISILLGIVLLASAATVAARGKPGNTGKPGPGDTQILPINLGPAAECPRTLGLALNDGDTAGLYVVGQGLGCSNPALVGAVRWSGGLGMQYLGLLPGSTGSSAEGVSEDGTVVGWTGGNIGEAFVLEPGSVQLARLQPLPGMVHATAENISRNGLYIVGTSSTEEEQHAVVWTKTGGSWQVRDLARYSGSPAIADNGSALLNTRLDELGTVNSVQIIAANRQRTTLPGFDVVALDIAADGRSVVGYRLQPCPQPCGEYPVPVYWTLLANGTWAGPVDLPALDGVDSEARPISLRNGKRLIVGHGFTKKDAIMRAVAWIEDSPGKFSLHRLAAIDGKTKAWAWARDVNAHGQVTGASQSTGLTYYAVLWQLP
jgi:uncharacterized membrane protein